MVKPNYKGFYLWHRDIIGYGIPISLNDLIQKAFKEEKISLLL